ncbi:hypothetical protein Tco_1409502, partial [Tanacetum coccineum]
DFDSDLEPLDELDLDSFNLEPLDGSTPLLVFLFFNPWSGPAGGSPSLSLSSRPLFKEYVLPYESKRSLSS